jgi:hypothetical protein
VPFVRDLVRPRREAAGEELLLRAERALLRLARVNQYRSFLASPVSGRAEVVYRFRTVAGTAAASPPEDDEDWTMRRAAPRRPFSGRSCVSALPRQPHTA